MCKLLNPNCYVLCVGCFDPNVFWIFIERFIVSYIYYIKTCTAQNYVLKARISNKNHWPYFAKNVLSHIAILNPQTFYKLTFFAKNDFSGPLRVPKTPQKLYFYFYMIMKLSYIIFLCIFVIFTIFGNFQYLFSIYWIFKNSILIPKNYKNWGQIFLIGV